MTEALRPIGLLGGTFDPIHVGHLTVAEMLLTELDLQEIQFIPNRQPPHRETPIADPNHRLTMTRLATAYNNRFIVNDLETARPKPSYTSDTLKTLRAQKPNQSLCLILGTDVFALMNQWYRWETILDLAHLIIINRPEYLPPKEPWMQHLLKTRQTNHFDHCVTKIAGKIFFQEINPIPISATTIRNKIATGEDVSQEIPKKVLQYIQKHHLYS